jgi:hypothetical protein
MGFAAGMLERQQAVKCEGRHIRMRGRTIGARSRIIVVGLACAIGVSMVAATVAQGARVNFSGPANAPGTTVEFRVGIKDGKVGRIGLFEVLKPYTYCSDGTERVIGSDQLDDSHDFPELGIETNKKGKFHAIDVDDEVDPEDTFPPSGNIYEIAGRIRKNSASGTFRMTFNFRGGPSCDTGVVSWTATRL